MTRRFLLSLLKSLSFDLRGFLALQKTEKVIKPQALEKVQAKFMVGNAAQGTKVFLKEKLRVEEKEPLGGKFI